MSLTNAHISLLCDTHHTTTQQENIDIKCAFQSYYMKKYILVHFEILQKKKILSVHYMKKVNCSFVAGQKVGYPRHRINTSIPPFTPGLSPFHSTKIKPESTKIYV